MRARYSEITGLPIVDITGGTYTGTAANWARTVIPDGGETITVELGDVLTAVDGKPVADSIGMLNLVAALAPGSRARLQLQRGPRTVNVTVTVGRRPRPEPLKP